MPTDTLPVAPGHLTKDARALWRELVEEYDFEPVELATLTLALEAYDHAATARRRLKRDGRIVVDRFGQPKAHPAATIHKDALATWARLMAQLRLPADEDDGSTGRNLRGQFTGKGGRSGRA
ncbi:MAG TPA: P27 family phage terminase small subunit [Solirubrobacterales bacterium]|nr:P27 family phage terminase small subunit [Solirubrobacterales bacterium]